MKTFKIGEISKKAGVSQRTVRYYEEIGLIKPSGRTEGSFRLFTESMVEKIQFIQSMKDLGLSLEDIKAILTIRKENKRGKDAAERVLGKLSSTHEKIQDRQRRLSQAEREIRKTEALVNECLTCNEKPTAKNCLKCPVVLNKEDIPEPFRTILELEK